MVEFYGIEFKVRKIKVRKNAFFSGKNVAEEIYGMKSLDDIGSLFIK
jgi:hypothetical protein